MSTNLVEQLTFSACVADFIFDRKSKNRSPKTLSFYEAELKYFYDWLEKVEAPIEVEQITSTLIKRYLIDLSTHRNRGGVHCAFRVIKAFFNWYEFEYEPEWKNPIKKVTISTNKQEPLPDIPLDNVQLLLNHCTGRNSIRDKCIIKFLIDSGLRASELLALNIEDVDITSGMVKVKHGKGDKMRIVWIGQNTIKAVKVYVNDRKGNTPLFLNDENVRLKFFGLRQIINRLCRKAEIKEWGLHSFRRSYALTLYRKGIDILTISRLLGHTSIEVTKRYLNINNEDLREAHNRASPADSLE